jgi:phage host-nuclease inhibitor protein Gam
MTKRIKQPSRKLTRTEVESLVADIAEATNEKRAITAALEAQILALRKEQEETLSALDADIKVKFAQVKAWADTSTEEFGKLKSIKFPFGTIGFRTGTPALSLLSKKWSWAKVLEAVQQTLPNFVRTKPEVDKEAILNQREELKEFLPQVGLKVTQSEAFYVEPDLTAIEKRVSAAA